MKPVQSFRIYPRPDVEYKKKSSLDFQRVMGNLYGLRPTGNLVQGYLWMLCGFIGFVMGSIAFLMDLLVEEITTVRWEATQRAAEEYSGLAGWLVMLIISVVIIAIASSFTVIVAPVTIGSGVAEAIGILNGV